MDRGTADLLSLTARAELIAREFAVQPEQIQSMTKHFIRQMKTGLTDDLHWQLPTFVRSVPDGTEKGRFLAVDLGGSNCRICLVDFHGDTTFAVVQTTQRVPPDIMVNASHKPLFAFIANEISLFLVAHHEKSQRQPHDSGDTEMRYKLGFTFSFTCHQTSLRDGTLIHWDKGWNIPDAVGRNPCDMLQEAIDDLKLPVVVSVLANDSVGTLLTRSYTSGKGRSTLAAVIFGTGTNAAYIEKLSNVSRLGLCDKADGEMVINTEWGSFDDRMEVLPRTVYDDELDAASSNAGAQMLEKRISGMYLGELLRLVILRLAQENAFQMVIDPHSNLLRRDSIQTSVLSQLAATDEKSSVENGRIIMEALGVSNVSPDDILGIQLLASAIARRAARLAGAALAAIVVHSGRLEARASLPSSNGTDVKECPLHKDIGTITSPLERIRRKLHTLICKVLRALRLSRPRTTTSFTAAISTESSFEEGNSIEEVIDIGADGSLIEFYPGFEAEMRVALRSIPEIGVSGEQRIRIGLAKDGSGVGAALMAQAAVV